MVSATTFWRSANFSEAETPPTGGMLERGANAPKRAQRRRRDPWTACPLDDGRRLSEVQRNSKARCCFNARFNSARSRKPLGELNRASLAIKLFPLQASESAFMAVWGALGRLGSEETAKSFQGDKRATPRVVERVGRRLEAAAEMRGRGKIEELLGSQEFAASRVATRMSAQPP